MRVYIIPAWYPKDANDNVASFFREQAHALVKKGIDVTVIHIEPISVTRIGKQPLHEMRAWQDGSIRTYFHKLIIPIPSKVGYLQDRCISKAFHRIIECHLKDDINSGFGRPDILHAHVSHSCGYYCLEASRKLQIPLVITEHYSGLLTGEASKADFKRVKNSIEGSDAFIFVGSRFQSAVCSKLNIRNETYVIPNMIAVPKEGSVRSERGNDDAFRFLTACRLGKNKSVHLVIRALHKAFTAGEAVELEIAGDGKELDYLKGLAGDLGESERVRFSGRYLRNEWPTVFGRADAFVLTSEYETFGVVYIEAMMCGLPCIGTNGQGADDIISDDSGLLVNYGDVDELALAMRTIYKNHRYSRSVIRKRAIVMFSEEKVANQLIGIYAGLLSD